MEFSELDDLIYSLGVEPTREQLDLLYQQFENDFVNNHFAVNGLKVKVALAPSKEPGFEAYPESFVHLIARKNSNGKRVFDRHRANKIHWVRSILENQDQADITFFQYPEADGTLRDYFWYKDGDFLVIMKKISPDYVIVTSFHVDDKRNKDYFEKKEKWYRENQE